MNLRPILSILILISCLELTAHGKDLVEVKDIRLTQNLKVRGDLLCQDGQHIYFRDKKSCEAATDELSCEDFLVISPIQFIEKVYLPSGEFVAQFFSIKTKYERNRYELVSEEPIKNYKLVESKQIPFPLCHGMRLLESRSIRKIRNANDSEIPFLTGLLDSGVSVVNTPYGAFTNLAKRSKDPEVNPFVAAPALKSPLCNGEADPDEIIRLASGEWTGGGIIQASFVRKLHNQSKELSFRAAGPSYEFFCKSEGF